MKKLTYQCQTVDNRADGLSPVPMRFEKIENRETYPGFGDSLDSRSDLFGGWFCVRSLPKSEHIAAKHLGKIEGVEVFCPRISYRKAREQGPVLVTEALFPGYLFARFDYSQTYRRVKACPSVSTIVHFGDHVPCIEDAIIQGIRRELHSEDIVELEQSYQVGQEISISGGVFNGLHAIITSVFPARERLKVLFCFLGQPTVLDVSFNSVVQDGLVQRAFGVGSVP